MDQVFKTGCYLVLFLVSASMTIDHRSLIISSDPQSTPPSIVSKTIHLDFMETGQRLSLNNAVRTQQGIQADNPTTVAILSSEAISVPIDTVEPFLAFGSRWIASSTSEDLMEKSVQLEIRHATDDQQWSSWESMQLDEHLTTAADTAVGQLRFLPQTTRYIQFRFILKPSAPDEGFGLRSVLFSFASPGSTPRRTLEALKNRSKGRKSQEGPMRNKSQPYPMPDYITRTEWECPDGQDPSGPVVRTDVTHQIVHHSAGSNSSEDWPAVVRAIWDYHVNTNDWSDIGYNWLVDPDGNIYQGRGWLNGDDEVQGAHFCGTNANTMGACLLGNFEEEQPATEALASLEELLAWKSDQKAIDPLERGFHVSSGLNLYNISGHRDGCNTLCPGEFLYLELPEIRSNVDALIGESRETDGVITSLGNYPNPFSQETTITFTLEEAADIRITIWDLNGRMVQEVAQDFYPAERHQETWNASNFASGIYFCRIELNQQYAVQKMVLVR